MIIDVTYACNMGYSHCMSDCTPDGLHMPIQTFRDSLNFLSCRPIRSQHGIFPAEKCLSIRRLWKFWMF